MGYNNKSKKEVNMNKFEMVRHGILDLPINERFKYCQNLFLKHGKKINWSEAKEYYKQMFDCDVFKNDIYTVMVFRNKQADWQIHEKSWKGKMTYLSIKRNDKKYIHDWRDFQKIKNELVGIDYEAFEIYPNEKRLVDTANQYHLFCFQKNYIIPVGWLHRSVVNEELKGGFNQTGQRAREV